MQNENIIAFGDLVLREIGLDVDSNNHVVEEETGNPIMIKGKYLKFNHEYICRVNKDEVNYDPLNNSKQMSYLFGYYSDKIESEGKKGIDLFFTTESANNKHVLKAKRGDEILESNPYYNESVRYMDIVTKINESIEDVSKFDFKQEEPKLTSRKKR